MQEEDLAKLKESIQPKTWSETISYDTWEIFKVISEMVEGFEKLSRIGPCVSIFGSARIKDGHPYYKLAEEIAYLMTKAGFGIITGGGPGIMEAANKGAHFAGGKSVGLNINLPASVRAVTISGEAIKLWVPALPSFRLAKFRLNEFRIEFLRSGLSIFRDHCPMQGPHALAIITPPMLLNTSSNPSRSHVNRICSEPGVTINSDFTFKFFSSACFATDAAREISS